MAPSASLEPTLLAQGFALAGSAFRENGWAIDAALQDTKDLVEFFRDTIALPDYTIVGAASFSSLITYESMTKFGGLYDGAIVACGAGAGATRSWDTTADLLIAYDTVCSVCRPRGAPPPISVTTSISTRRYLRSSHRSYPTRPTLRGSSSSASSSGSPVGA